MRRINSIAVAMAGALMMLLASGLAARPDDRAELLKAREAVWRAWFANDAKTLEAMVPPDTIVIGSGQEYGGIRPTFFTPPPQFHAAAAS